MQANNHKIKYHDSPWQQEQDIFFPMSSGEKKAVKNFIFWHKHTEFID